jgi:hypothetical protein
MNDQLLTPAAISMLATRHHLSTSGDKQRIPAGKCATHCRWQWHLWQINYKLFAMADMADYSQSVLQLNVKWRMADNGGL